MSAGDLPEEPRPRTVGVRVTEEEYRTLRRLAGERDATVDALLRRRAVEPLIAEAAADAEGGGGRGR